MNPIDPLTPYRLWGRIEHSGPNEFVAIVTAMPENGDPSLVKVLSKVAPSREEAIALAKSLLQKMGEIARSNLPSICSPQICQIVPPSIAPIPAPRIPPIGTTQCKQEQVYSPLTKQYEWKTVCK